MGTRPRLNFKGRLNELIGTSFREAIVVCDCLRIYVVFVTSFTVLQIRMTVLR